ncbi:unnamed protein product, partial [Amoebophrya sp. A25]
LEPIYPHLADLHISFEMQECKRIMHGYCRINAPRLNLQAPEMMGQAIAQRRAFGSFVDGKNEVWDEHAPLIDCLDRAIPNCGFGQTPGQQQSTGGGDAGANSATGGGSSNAPTSNEPTLLEQEISAILRQEKQRPAYETRMSQISFILADPNVQTSLCRGLCLVRKWRHISLPASHAAAVQKHPSKDPTRAIMTSGRHGSTN